MRISPAGSSISRVVLIAALVGACGSDPENASIGPSPNSRTEEGGRVTGVGGGMAMSGSDSGSSVDTARATGGASATTGGFSANSGGAATANGGTATGGRETSTIATGGRETSTIATGGRAIGGSLSSGTLHGAGTAATAGRANGGATRDLIAPSMQRWFNKWFALLFPYACFPYPSVVVTVSGWAVKPGQESLLQWTDRTIPVYTEVSDGTDQAKGEPKCPDACGFFFHSDHVFTNCPGGVINHFDYTLWLNDKVPSGVAAEGSDWGVRIPVASFLKDINTENFGVMLHEMGHGFGLSDYYSWTGSTPTGGSVMFAGSAGVLTPGDQWMVRRYWKETKAVRYP